MKTEPELEKPKKTGRGIYVRRPDYIAKIKATQTKRVAEGLNNRAVQKECIYCGLKAQQYMIDRWHNENCKKRKDELSRVWLYTSPKLDNNKIRS